MAYTTIDNPELYFQTKLYTGNGSTQSITLDGDENMQPDFVWIKQRNAGSTYHWLADVIRGVTKYLSSNVSSAEATETTQITSFDSDGFSLGNKTNTNDNSDTYVAWNWKAGTSFTNDASATGVGSHDSSGSINTTAGFSIMTYTGTGSTTTLGHGLGVVPKWIIVKNRGRVKDWCVYHVSLGETHKIELNDSQAASDDNAVWNDTAPTSSVFTVGPSDERTNASSDTYVAYCFAEKKGYSKFGSYTGNGNADGTFVYTGFKPAFVIQKVTNTTAQWNMHDSVRDPFNQVNRLLYPSNSNAEENNISDQMDFLSNGFKFKNTGAASNGSGNTYIYMSFAESPFVTSTGIPTTAR